MTKATHSEQADVIVIGGGFYGACVALHFAERMDQVVLLEAESQLLGRASFVNQARVHTGFHYPRSFNTARRSLALYQRFSAEFRDAIVDDFRMLYAIARHGSKISPRRFERMFREIGAPIETASEADLRFFNEDLVSAVFRCEEYAFDAIKLRDLLSERLTDADVDVRLGRKVISVHPGAVTSDVQLADGRVLTAPIVVNATYGNATLEAFDPDFYRSLKYELTEVALMRAPPELEKIGITMMDGPFFSMMPFPARNCHSLTHVRYTPHAAWVPGQAGSDITAATGRSNWIHMLRDATRYVPSLRDSEWQESLFEVKTVLLRNESDDGRPILYSSHRDAPGYVSILGGKLDNIYDLFEVMENESKSASGRARREAQP